MTTEHESRRCFSFRPSPYQVSRLFGLPFGVSLAVLVIWWVPPAPVTIAAILLIVGGVVGVILGAVLRLDIDSSAVHVRTPFGLKEFPARQSSARTESTRSFFGIRRFSFLVLERHGTERYSVRIPLSEFSRSNRVRMVDETRAAFDRS